MDYEMFYWFKAESPEDKKVKIPEDKIIFSPPYFFGVLDGVSGVYHPQYGLKLFNGRSGGQMVTQTVAINFDMAHPECNLVDILKNASYFIEETCLNENILLSESDRLPGASYAIAKIGKENINIVQGGDTFAVWQMKDGTYGGTPNQSYDYEMMLHAIIKKLMRKHNYNRAEMWRQYLPIFSEKKLKNINTDSGKFSELNGQPWFIKYMQKFTLVIEEISLLIFFSDGLVPFGWTENVKYLSERVIGLYNRGGLHYVHAETQKIMESEKGLTHEDNPEASALALEF